MGREKANATNTSINDVGEQYVCSFCNPFIFFGRIKHFQSKKLGEENEVFINYKNLHDKL